MKNFTSGDLFYIFILDLVMSLFRITEKVFDDVFSEPHSKVPIEFIPRILEYVQDNATNEQFIGERDKLFYVAQIEFEKSEDYKIWEDYDSKILFLRKKCRENVREQVDITRLRHQLCAENFFFSFLVFVEKFKLALFHFLRPEIRQKIEDCLNDEFVIEFPRQPYRHEVKKTWVHLKEMMSENVKSLYRLERLFSGINSVDETDAGRAKVAERGGFSVHYMFEPIYFAFDADKNTDEEEKRRQEMFHIKNCLIVNRFNVDATLT